MDWTAYYELTEDRPPRDLLVRAAGLAPRGRALDLGCGAGADAQVLAEAGFAVTAVDRDPAAAAFVTRRVGGAIHFVCSPLADFAFGDYELVTSLFVLPFLGARDLAAVVRRAVASLTPGGVILFNAFGPRDEWATSPDMTFLTRDEVAALVDGLEVVELGEEEFDGETADGTEKHWHLVTVIARRPA